MLISSQDSQNNNQSIVQLKNNPSTKAFIMKTIPLLFIASCALIGTANFAQAKLGSIDNPAEIIASLKKKNIALETERFNQQIILDSLNKEYGSNLETLTNSIKRIEDQQQKGLKFATDISDYTANSLALNLLVIAFYQANLVNANQALYKELQTAFNDYKDAREGGDSTVGLQQTLDKDVKALQGLINTKDKEGIKGDLTGFNGAIDKVMEDMDKLVSSDLNFLNAMVVAIETNGGSPVLDNLNTELFDGKLIGDLAFEFDGATRGSLPKTL